MCEPIRSARMYRTNGACTGLDFGACGGRGHRLVFLGSDAHSPCHIMSRVTVELVQSTPILPRARGRRSCETRIRREHIRLLVVADIGHIAFFFLLMFSIM